MAAARKRRAAPKKANGRPTIFSQALVDDICERIANGESLRAISRDDTMPAMSTVFRWLNERQEFSEQYARAKDEQAEAFADEITDIADTEEDVQRAKVRIDARKWVASKLKPKKYGDRIDHTSSDRSMTPAPTRIELVAPDHSQG